MSQDYGIDNEGTGFALDDDDDMESMFNRAADAAEAGEDGDDSHLAYLSDDYTAENVSEPVKYTTETENYEDDELSHVIQDDEESDEEDSSVWEIVNQQSSPAVREEISNDVPTYDDTVDSEDLNDDDYESHEEFVVEDNNSDSYAVDETEDDNVEFDDTDNRYSNDEVSDNTARYVDESPRYEETISQSSANSELNDRPKNTHRNYSHSVVDERYVTEERYSNPERQQSANRYSDDTYSAASPTVSEEVQETNQEVPAYHNENSYQTETPSTNYNTNQNNTTTQTRRFNITTEAEDIANARKIIRVLDVYRNIPESQKNTVAQLIYNENDVDHKDEAKLVVKVLHADPILPEMMTALRESAMEKDRVERVFYILRLRKNLLDNLGEFLNTIVDVEFTDKNDQIGYSKEMENAINDLDPKIVQFVADAQAVLSAANDVE